MGFHQYSQALAKNRASRATAAVAVPDVTVPTAGVPATPPSATAAAPLMPTGFTPDSSEAVVVRLFHLSSPPPWSI